jgi:uroporphyrinogen decarboxylase
MSFEPDYRHFEEVMANRRPERLPFYEHIIETPAMEKILNRSFSGSRDGTAVDRAQYFREYCDFFLEMTYDTVSYEVCIVEVLPDSGAISGGRPGPIQSRDDFERYPWTDLRRRYWELARPRFDALVEALPAGMKAVGGVGNGVFEIAEDLVGLMYLPFIQADDPVLYAEIFNRIGDLMRDIWLDFLARYKDSFVACRFGDDLGFKASLLTNPSTIREHILPQYRRVIGTIHEEGKPFLWHSCGNIFEVMEDVLSLGIEAKHSNEDVIAPFDHWIDAYGDRIALVGGFDVHFLCTHTPEEIVADVFERGSAWRARAGGYALGSGNSIPPWFPPESYLAMIEGGQRIREAEASGV